MFGQTFTPKLAIETQEEGVKSSISIVNFEHAIAGWTRTYCFL